MPMPTPILISFSILALLNLISFLVMANDKAKAVRGNSAERTPEGVIFFTAACFGSIGVYAGMFIFRHKINKWYFQLGIPLLVLQNVATLYLLRLLIVQL